MNSKYKTIKYKKNKPSNIEDLVSVEGPLEMEIRYKKKDEWIVICDPGEGRAVGTILDNFHIREDLELRLLNSGEMLRIDLSGPDAEKIAEKLG